MLIAPACGNKEGEDAEATPAPTQALPVMGISVGRSNAFTDAFVAEFKAIAEADGYRVSVKDAAGNVKTQASGIETLIAEEAKGIIVFPAETDGLEFVLDECAAEGIAVIGVDSPINATYGTLITADFSVVGDKAAKLAAEAASDANRETSEVYMLLGSADSFKSQWILDGFSARVKETDSISINGIAYFDPAKQSTLEGISVKDLGAANVIFAENSVIAAAAREMLGETTTVDIITVGGEAQAIDAVKEGMYYATIYYSAEQTAQYAYDAIVNGAGTYVALDIAVASESSVGAVVLNNGYATVKKAQPEAGEPTENN